MTTLTTPRFVEQWRHAGLSDSLPELIEAYTATLARIEAERRAAAAATVQARQDRAEHIAHGRTGDFPALPDAQDFDAARKIAERAFTAAVREIGDSLILDDLAPAHAELLSEARELVPLIGTLSSDAQAVDRTTTPQAREAWARLGGLWRDRALLLDLLHTLLVDEAIPNATLPAERAALTQYRRFARPHGSAGGSTFAPVGPKTPEPLAMAGLVRNAWQTQPGVFTLEQARQHKAAVDAQAFAEARHRDGGSGVTDPHRNKAIDAARERERNRAAEDRAQFRGQVTDELTQRLTTTATRPGRR